MDVIYIYIYIYIWLFYNFLVIIDENFKDVTFINLKNI